MITGSLLHEVKKCIAVIFAAGAWVYTLYIVGNFGELLRWKVNYAGLTGPATAGHFHGPSNVGANAGVVVPWPGPIGSPMEGSATLTAAQATDLMAGRWYANIHTAANPGGEVRGQMTARY